MITINAAPSPFVSTWLAMTRHWLSVRLASERTLPETASELLRRADVYAPTQPGYAADLRAAAQRMIERQA